MVFQSGQSILNTLFTAYSAPPTCRSDLGKALKKLRKANSQTLIDDGSEKDLYQDLYLLYRFVGPGWATSDGLKGTSGENKLTLLPICRTRVEGIILSKPALIVCSNACFAAAMANTREWDEKKAAFLEYRQRMEGEMPGLCD